MSEHTLTCVLATTGQATDRHGDPDGLQSHEGRSSHSATHMLELSVTTNVHEVGEDGGAANTALAFIIKSASRHARHSHQISGDDRQRDLQHKKRSIGPISDRVHFTALLSVRLYSTRPSTL